MKELTIIGLLAAELLTVRIAGTRAPVDRMDQYRAQMARVLSEQLPSSDALRARIAKAEAHVKKLDAGRPEGIIPPTPLLYPDSVEAKFWKRRNGKRL